MNNVVKFDNMANNIVTIVFTILSLLTILLTYMITILSKLTIWWTVLWQNLTTLLTILLQCCYFVTILRTILRSVMAKAGDVVQNGATVFFDASQKICQIFPISQYSNWEKCTISLFDEFVVIATTAIIYIAIFWHFFSIFLSRNLNNNRKRTNWSI